MTLEEIAARLLVLERQVDDLSTNIRLLFQDVLDSTGHDDVD